MTSTDRVAVGPTRIGRGLLAARSFRVGDELIPLEGRVVNHALLWQRQGSRFAANCIRFGPETYLDPGDGFGAYLNHSCAPNAAIAKKSNRLYLVATRSIAKGDEVVIDYSTTIGDDDIWRMRCRCGQPSCRRLIRNFGSLPPLLRQFYLSNAFVPPFIVRTLVTRASPSADDSTRSPSSHRGRASAPSGTPAPLHARRPRRPKLDRA